MQSAVNCLDILQKSGSKNVFSCTVPGISGGFTIVQYTFSVSAQIIYYP